MSFCSFPSSPVPNLFFFLTCFGSDPSSPASLLFIWDNNWDKPFFWPSITASASGVSGSSSPELSPSAPLPSFPSSFSSLTASEMSFCSFPSSPVPNLFFFLTCFGSDPSSPASSIFFKWWIWWCAFLTASALSCSSPSPLTASATGESVFPPSFPDPVSPPSFALSSSLSTPEFSPISPDEVAGNALVASNLIRITMRHSPPFKRFML